MYKCNDCGNVFEHPKKESEQRGEYFGFNCIEDLFCCPSCNSSDYEEAQYCDCCGEIVNKENSLYCDNCLDVVRDKLNELSKELNCDIETIGDMVADIFEW